MRSRPTLGACAALGLLAGCTAVDELLNNPTELAIHKFVVSPREVAKGSTATLTWDVKGADEVQIDNGVGLVKGAGSLDVRAERTVTYTLSAKKGTASASSSLQLVVSGTAPGPSPSPSVSPTPQPTASPTPSPTPTPTPSPSVNGCRLPAMPECGKAEGPKGVFGCCRE